MTTSASTRRTSTPATTTTPAALPLTSNITITAPMSTPSNPSSSTISHRQHTTPIPIKQRHRSSFSQVRKRRPSDAAALHGEDRDRLASSRLQALSLSPPGITQQQQQQMSKSAPGGEDSVGAGVGVSAGAGGTTTHAGKKKSTIFRCETCAKAYRHPSCLVKHRWEHSPHWREASKFLLSKHQQVQLLEAAAILSHLSPPKSGGGTSLPEDRSLWPSYLSGGLLPMPTTHAHMRTASKDGNKDGDGSPNSSTSSSGHNHAKEDANMSTTSSDEESDVETPPNTTTTSMANTAPLKPESESELAAAAATVVVGEGTIAKSPPHPTLTQFRPGLLGHPNVPLGGGGAGAVAVAAAPIPVPGVGADGLPISGGAPVGMVASWGSMPPSSASVSVASSLTGHAPPSAYHPYTTTTPTTPTHAHATHPSQPFSYSYTPHSHMHSHSHAAFSYPHAHSYSYSMSSGLLGGMGGGAGMASGTGTGNGFRNGSTGAAKSLSLFEDHSGGRSWSLPRSSVRSGNGSVEGSDGEMDEGEGENMEGDGDGDVVVGMDGQGRVGTVSTERDAEEWEMEMDV